MHSLACNVVDMGNHRSKPYISRPDPKFIKEQRTVMADNTISLRNRIFQILPDKYRISFAKAKVVVEKRLDGSIHIRYKDQYLNFKEISSDEIKKIKTNALPLEKLLTGDIFTLHQG